MTITEMRAKRAKAWEAAKAFLDSHRQENGLLSAEDDVTYGRMEADISAYNKEIARLERQEALDNELNMPTSRPITEKPEAKEKSDAKTGRASDAYRKAFWDKLRSKDGVNLPEIRNALEEGADTEGGYLVPDEFEHTLIQAMESETVIRPHATVITTSSGLHKIPVVASHGSAAWIDEEGAYTESDEAFGQVQLDAQNILRIKTKLPPRPKSKSVRIANWNFTATPAASSSFMAHGNYSPMLTVSRHCLSTNSLGLRKRATTVRVGRNSSSICRPTMAKK